MSELRFIVNGLWALGDGTDPLPPGYGLASPVLYPSMNLFPSMNRYPTKDPNEPVED